MAKNDLNKARIEAVRHEAAYQAEWDILFNSNAKVQPESKRKGDDERCECGYHREACKFGTDGCPK